MKYDLVFAGMIRESHGRFWDVLAERFEAEGKKVGFLAAMDAAAVPLAHRGDDAYCIPRVIRQAGYPDPTAEEIARIESTYGLTSLRHLFIHEMYSTERYDEERLTRKTVNYFRACEAFFDEHDVGLVVEETGGWIECRVVFHIARQRNIPHLFIEPAPFSRRIIFARNSMTVDFDGMLDGASLPPDLRRDLDAYIAETTGDPKVLVPHKDTAYYHDATFTKVFNFSAFAKVMRIAHRKAFVNKFEETYSTRILVWRYVKSVLRRTTLGLYYNRLPDDMSGDVFFPLHNPFDMQILVRAPHCFRQEYVVEMISRALPQGVRLFVKEHPVSIGWYSFRALRKCAGLPNVVLLHPRESSHEVVRRCRAVITINSKVGYEALAYYKPVITLGASFYRGHGATFDVSDPADIAPTIKRVFAAEVNRNAIDGLIATAMRRSRPGELYNTSEENLSWFKDALDGEWEVVRPKS